MFSLNGRVSFHKPFNFRFVGRLKQFDGAYLAVLPGPKYNGHFAFGSKLEKMVKVLCPHCLGLSFIGDKFLSPSENRDDMRFASSKLLLYLFLCNSDEVSP